MKCPQCQTEQLRPAVLTFEYTAPTGIILAIQVPGWRCVNCGYEEVGGDSAEVLEIWHESIDKAQDLAS